MGTISRWMPPLPEARCTPIGYAATTGFCAVLLVWAYYSPEFRWLLLALGAWTVLLNFGHQGELRRLRAERTGEDIGTFARAFDRRAVDPRIIRGVWEALQEELGQRRRPAPLRAADRLEALDVTEVELLAEEVADRVGRSLAGLEANPLYGRVDTVGDLVHFLNAQPRRAAT